MSSIAQACGGGTWAGCWAVTCRCKPASISISSPKPFPPCVNCRCCVSPMSMPITKRMRAKSCLVRLSLSPSHGRCRVFQRVSSLTNCPKISTISSRSLRWPSNGCHCWRTRGFTPFSMVPKVSPPMMPITSVRPPRWTMSGSPPGSTLSGFSRRAARAWRWRNGWKTGKNPSIWVTWTSRGCSRFRAIRPIWRRGRPKRWACSMPITFPIAKRRPRGASGAARCTHICRSMARSWANLRAGSGPIGSPIPARRANIAMLGAGRTGSKIKPPNTPPSARALGSMICRPSAKSGSRG